MSTSNLVAAGLYSALSTTLGSGTAVFRTQAPDEQALPYAVFSQYAGGPANLTPSDLRELVYYVRGYGSSMAQAGTVDAAISGRLHHGTIAVSGYTTVSINREMDLELVEIQPNGEKMFMAGGLYRIMLDA